MWFRSLQTIVTVLLVALFLGCRNPEAPDCIQRAGQIAIIENTLPNFTSLELHDMIHYQLHVSNEYKIKITGPENWINKIEVDVQNSRLKISDENHCKLIRNKQHKIIVDLYAPEYIEVINESYLQVEVMDTLHQHKLKWINENAPSNCSILFHGDSCVIEMPKGIGDIILSGQSHFTSLYSNAIGKLDASKMRTQYLNCNHNSLQDIYAQTENYLFVIFQNKGNLILPFLPPQVDKQKNSTGDLIISSE